MNTLHENNRPRVKTPEYIEQTRELRKELVSYLQQLEEVDTLFAWWLQNSVIKIEIEDLLEVVHYYTVLPSTIEEELKSLRRIIKHMTPYINMARVDARRQGVQL